MTIGESHRSIAASDGKPINVYQWKGPGPGRGIVQIAHGMGEHPLRYRSRDEAMVIAAIEAVLGTHGRIDGLVNNAGGQFARR
jgi:alpha-beta hydrolase superfamily lysophospholipase